MVVNFNSRKMMISPVAWATATFISPQSAKLGNDVHKSLLPFSSSSHKLHLSPNISNSKFRPPFICQCINKEEIKEKTEQGFSVLGSEIPWEIDNIWTTMALYIFNLHIPLGVGGLSIAAYILHRPTLDPQTEAVSLLFIQILELVGTLILLKLTAKPKSTVPSFFQANKSAEGRSWLLASTLGFGFLILSVFVTSIISDELLGTKAVDNTIVKEILQSSNTSKAACILVYCFITPLLEETIYRFFLLTSLASTMDWQKSVLISSAIFSAAHFSGENFMSLFVVGCVLGCSYCWTGKLRTSFLIHCLYNAFTLVITFA